MIRTRVSACLLALVLPAAAAAEEVRSGTGAQLRGLDRLTGTLADLDVAAGASVELGRLMISLVECRYPAANPAGDAYAYLLIDDVQTGAKVFEGWMVASSPALNALDHPRYDVWVLRCNRA